MSDDPSTTGTDPAKGTDPSTTDPQLGEAGKKALEAERERARTAERSAKDAQKQLETARKELETIKAGTQSEHEKALEQARKEGETGALSKVNRRIVAAEVKAAAAGKLADPDIASRLIDLDDFKVDNDGNVDSKQVAKAIDDLVKEKPYLAATGARGPGNGDGGARGKTSTGDWLRDAVLKR